MVLSGKDGMTGYAAQDAGCGLLQPGQGNAELSTIRAEVDGSVLNGLRSGPSFSLQ